MPDEADPPKMPSWVKATGAVVLAVVLLAVVVMAMSGGEHGPGRHGPQRHAADGGMHDDASPVAEGAVGYNVSARSFAFEPATLTIPVGTNVAIVLTSSDALHDFTIDAFDAHVAADAGETRTGGFHAGPPGRYAFYCSVPGHREAGMEGELVVGGR